MKTKLFGVLVAFVLSGAIMGQSAERKSIEKTVHAFAIAGEKQDVQAFEHSLHGDYQVIMNRLFGSEETIILSRAEYLKKIETKEFGGEKRKVTIEHVEVNGTSAVAKVLMEGASMTFRSLLVLVEMKDGSWRIISDIPSVL